MIITQIRQISSCDDFELNIKRQNLLDYQVSYPSNKPIEAILFIIPGFGNDTNKDYLTNLQSYVAETFSTASVTVNHHCMQARFENGAKIELDNIDIAVLQEVAKTYNIDFSSLNEINIDTVLEHLNASFELQKREGILPIDQKIMLSLTLVPPNNEYQNFGIMQALDYINVYYDLIHVLPNLSPSATTIFLGSSHGGYIAHMIAKLAPSIVDYVIDNSCYVKPPLEYVTGKETDITEPEIPIFFESYPHLIGHGYTQTLWTTNTESPFHFCHNRYRIRNLMDTEHLQIMSKIKKPTYISYHSLHDTLASARDKINFYNDLNELGYRAELKLIHSKEQIDGRLIKHLEHAMDMSLKELINTELPPILNSLSHCEIRQTNEITYPCDTIVYKFKSTENSYQCECFAV